VAKEEELPVDLDFDLFDFAEVMPDDAPHVEEDIDLDKILSAFQEEEDEAQRPAGPEKEVLDDELFDLTYGRGDEAQEPAAPPQPPQPPAAARKTTAAAKQAEARAPAPEKTPAPEVQKAPRERAAELNPEDGGTPPAAEAPVRRRSLVGSSVLLAFLAMTLLNGLIAVVTLRSASGLKGEMKSASAEMTEAALELRTRADPAPPVELAHRESPLAAPLADDDAVFEQAQADIEEGSCAAARKRIYALLAVIDRTPEPRRTDLEARSAFLLADSYRAEALAAEESP
jgi:hypothetical protein